MEMLRDAVQAQQTIARALVTCARLMTMAPHLRDGLPIKDDGSIAQEITPETERKSKR